MAMYNHNFYFRRRRRKSAYRQKKMGKMIHNTITQLGLGRYMPDHASLQFQADHHIDLHLGWSPTDYSLRSMIYAVYGVSRTMSPLYPTVYLKKGEFYKVCADGYEVLKPIDGQIMKCVGVMQGNMIVYIMRSCAIRKGQHRYTRFIIAQSPLDKESICDIFRPLGKEG